MTYDDVVKMASIDMNAELELCADFSFQFKGSFYEISLRKSGSIDSIRKVVDGPSYWEETLYEMSPDMRDALAHLSVMDFKFVRWYD